VFAPIFVKAYQYLRQSKTNMLVDTFYTYHGNGIHSTEAFNETGCKVARLHNTCIYSVASRSWCQITPFTQSCIMSSRILVPKYRCGYPWPPQTAAGRNTPGMIAEQLGLSLKVFG